VEEAWHASNGFRVSINEARNRQREQTITVADLIDHYKATELVVDLVDRGKSHATKTVCCAPYGIGLNRLHFDQAHVGMQGEASQAAVLC
jgi:hypothetical protein